VTWPGFRASTIAVDGIQVVSEQEVLKKAGIDTRANLWLQNMRAAQRRIESIPYVKSAQMHRSLPATLSIEITERSPEAVIVTGQGTAMIDADRRVLETDGLYPEELPRIWLRLEEPVAPGRFLKDPRIARLQRDYQVLRKNDVLAHGLQLNRGTELTVQLRSGVRLMLGQDGDLAAKAALVQPILHQIEGKLQEVTALDLRAPKTPVVVYK
jgi:cell division protein FtsQ